MRQARARVFTYSEAVGICRNAEPAHSLSGHNEHCFARRLPTDMNTFPSIILIVIDANSVFVMRLSVDGVTGIEDETFFFTKSTLRKVMSHVSCLCACHNHVHDLS